jgi:hypothetical protein
VEPKKRSRSKHRQGIAERKPRGLITSARCVPIPDASPGDAITITTTLKAPTYDCASIAYFKQVDSD